MTTLSEADSKRLLARHGVSFLDERLASNAGDAIRAAEEIGFPVVLKLGGPAIAHKTERGLVRIRLNTAQEVADAAEQLLAAATPEDGATHLLVAPMVFGARELIAGVHHDHTFGMVVMLGVGGIFAEAVDRVTCRLVPIERSDAEAMIDDPQLEPFVGHFRGEPPVQRDALTQILVALSNAAVSDPTLVSAELNPLIVTQGRPVPVDALVVRGAVDEQSPEDADAVA